MNLNQPAHAPEISSSFDLYRQRAGLFIAPLVGVALWFLPISGLTAEAHRLLAILGTTVVLWITEAMPLPVTALLGPTLCVLAGVAPPNGGPNAAREIFRGFADPIIFLFLGSFLLAEAMLHHGLNRRVAFHILGLRGVGENPARVMLAFGAITGGISMWVSNTATTAMMFPIGVAILTEMARLQSRRTGREIKFTELRYGTGLMLMASFASSVGGLATPVGTPPNLIGLGIIEQQLGVKISFFQWMAFGLPLALVLIGFLGAYLNRTCPADPGLMSGGARWIQEEKSRLGPLSAGERNVLIAFLATVTFWVLPGLIAIVAGTEAPACRWLNRHLPEAMVSLFGACLLFVLPTDWRSATCTLTWREATRIDWGTILLFGGGLALGDLMFSTGLARWIGEGLAHALDAKTTLGLVVLFAIVATLVSETTSNAASATMVVPVAIAVARAAGVDPIQPALAACLGASMGFMLPVSTPPNAIVYGSGCIPLLTMVKYGLLLDLVAFLVIVPVTTWLVPLVLKL
jgi:sodium-dependent dicarboxylate transporter 2/3/5